MLLPPLWEAVEVGTVGAVAFFLDRNQPVDASLFPNLVRYFAKRFLADRNIEVVDELAPHQPSGEFETIPLSNNGLCIVRGRYAIRIRKSDDGQIPVPGKSVALQLFYRQQPLPFNLINGPAQIVDTSLLLLWDVDLQHHLTRLTLVRPRDGGTSRSSVESDWSIPLANPMTSRRSPAIAQPAEELEEIQLLDVPDSQQQSG